MDTENLRKAFEQVWNLGCTYYGQVSSGYSKRGETPLKYLALVEETLAALAPAAAQVPVAWRYQTPTGWHATTDPAAAGRVADHHEVQPLYAAPVAADAGAQSAEIAGLESAIGHLSALVEEQRLLLVDVDAICGVDGHGGTLEDGESEIIDRVRAHLAILADDHFADARKLVAQPDERAAFEASNMSRHSRAMLLNVLWHHQGSNSTVGQPLRAMLGLGQHDHLNDEQVGEAKWIDGLLAQPEYDFKNFHRLLCERFGYVHDERDWKLDQLSLIEWIAASRATTPQPGALTEARTPSPVSAAACIAPACHLWDGTDTCTCQRQSAMAVLGRVATALPVLRTMLQKEGLGGVDVADEMIADARAALAPTPTGQREGDTNG